MPADQGCAFPRERERAEREREREPDSFSYLAKRRALPHYLSSALIDKGQAPFKSNKTKKKAFELLEKVSYLQKF